MKNLKDSPMPEDNRFSLDEARRKYAGMLRVEMTRYVQIVDHVLKYEDADKKF